MITNLEQESIPVGCVPLWFCGSGVGYGPRGVYGPRRVQSQLGYGPGVYGPRGSMVWKALPPPLANRLTDTCGKTSVCGLHDYRGYYMGILYHQPLGKPLKSMPRILNMVVHRSLFYFIRDKNRFRDKSEICISCSILNSCIGLRTNCSEQTCLFMLYNNYLPRHNRSIQFRVCG